VRCFFLKRKKTDTGSRANHNQLQDRSGMVEEPEMPQIGQKAESLLCAGVFDVDDADDFEIVHKFTSTLTVPSFGGSLEVHARHKPLSHIHTRDAQ